MEKEQQTMFWQSKLYQIFDSIKWFIEAKGPYHLIQSHFQSLIKLDKQYAMNWLEQSAGTSSVTR